MEEKFDNNSLDENKDKLNLENDCSCVESDDILFMPEEYFYNTCSCINCDEESLMCGSDVVGNPLNSNYKSCVCSHLNIVD